MNVRSIAVPAEHGAWGFLIESALIGFILAPSWTGLHIFFAALLGLFMTQPLKIVFSDYPVAGASPRFRPAIGFIFIYGGFAFVFFAIALLQMRAHFWIPFVLAFPLFAVHFFFVLHKRKREWLPQIFGGLAICSLTPAILMAGGWPLWDAGLVWVILGMRTVCSILLIRNKFREGTRNQFSERLVFAAYGAGLLILLGLVLTGNVPWLVAAGFVILCFDAVHLLLKVEGRLKPKQLGFREMGYGLINSFFIVLGYLLR